MLVLLVCQRLFLGSPLFLGLSGGRNPEMFCHCFRRWIDDEHWTLFVFIIVLGNDTPFSFFFVSVSCRLMSWIDCLFDFWERELSLV